MVGKTGAARIALATGCPVIPIAQWGPQQLLPPYARRPHVFPRKTGAGHGRSAGRPLRGTRASPSTPAMLQAATDAIMADLDRVCSEICAASGRRPSGTTRASTASRESGTRAASDAGNGAAA